MSDDRAAVPSRTALTMAAIAVVIGVISSVIFLRALSPSQVSTPHQPAAAASAPKVFTLVVAHGRLAGGPAVISVIEGDLVTLRVVADASEELHLHGYDRKVELAAGRPVDLSFTADRSGRFPYELERARTQLGVVEVQPR